MAKKNLTDRQKRCQDCASLIEKNGKWCCDECFEQLCDDIDDCPEGVTIEELAEVEEKAKDIKVLGKSENPRAKAKKEPKIDADKVKIVDLLYKALSECDAERVAIANPQTEVTMLYNGSEYSVKLIKHRPKKEG